MGTRDSNRLADRDHSVAGRGDRARPARTIRFRLYDSSAIPRNLPWHAFYTTLFAQAPAFVIAVAVGLVAASVMWVRGRKGTRRLGVPLLPFGAYAVTAFMLSLAQRLVYVHHIVDNMAPLVVLAATPLVEPLGRAATRVTRVAIGVVIVTVLAVSAWGAVTPGPGVVGPQEHPGMFGVRDFLARYPEARIYFYHTILMSYYYPEGDVTGSPPRRWTTEKLAAIEAERFDFVVADRSMFSEQFPDTAALALALSPDYSLAQTIRHRRTGEPVAWLFARVDEGSGE